MWGMTHLKFHTVKKGCFSACWAVIRETGFKSRHCSSKSYTLSGAFSQVSMLVSSLTLKPYLLDEFEEFRQPFFLLLFIWSGEVSPNVPVTPLYILFFLTGFSVKSEVLSFLQRCFISTGDISGSQIRSLPNKWIQNSWSTCTLTIINNYVTLCVGHTTHIGEYFDSVCDALQLKGWESEWSNSHNSNIPRLTPKHPQNVFQEQRKFWKYSLFHIVRRTQFLIHFRAIIIIRGGFRIWD